MLLSILDGLEFFFLSCPDVVLLADGFFSEKLFVLESALASLGILTLILTLDPVLLEEVQEVYNLGVSLDVGCPGIFTLVAPGLLTYLIFFLLLYFLLDFSH